MEWVVIAVIAVVVVFFLMRSAGGSRSGGSSGGSSSNSDSAEYETRAGSLSKQDRQKIIDANVGWLTERWAAADKGSIEVPSWFNDPPTDRQLDRFRRDGLRVEAIGGAALTKGKASDIIGIFEPADEFDAEVLKRHGVSLRGMNQSRARHEVALIEARERAEANDDIAQDSPWWFPVEGTPRKVNTALTLDYESTSGKQTKRDVDVTAFYRGEAGCKFDCYCHLRKAKRTLSSKSVRRAVDRETGEVIENLCAYFESKYDLNPDKPYDLLFDRYAWAILVLRYIGSVDGAVRAPERKLIAEFCQRRATPGELDLEKLDAMLKEMASPTKYEFQRFIREQSANPEVLRDIYATTKALIATNKKQHSEHQLALEYMEKKWGEVLKA